MLTTLLLFPAKKELVTKRVDNSDEFQESPYTDSNPNLVQQCPKRN